METVIQRNYGCLLPGGVKGQVEWSCRQPDLVEDVPVYGRGVGPFYYSIIQHSYLFRIRLYNWKYICNNLTLIFRVPPYENSNSFWTLSTWYFHGYEIKWACKLQEGKSLTAFILFWVCVSVCLPVTAVLVVQLKALYWSWIRNISCPKELKKTKGVWEGRREINQRNRK